MSFLKLENVEKEYKAEKCFKALSDVSFQLENGEFVVIWLFSRGNCKSDAAVWRKKCHEGALL